jgi:cytochrome c551/c552
MTPDTGNAGGVPPPLPGRRLHVRNVLLILVLLAAGGGLTAWGISGAPASDHTREPAAVRRATQPVPIDAALVQRGAALQQLNCAGCHAVHERVVGPGFLEVARQYGDAANPLAAISAAMLHPSPGLADYPPGPPQAYLSSGDRDAIAGWIVQLSHDAK